MARTTVSTPASAPGAPTAPTALRWLMAGFAGIAIAVGASRSLPRAGFEPAAAALVAMMLGWGVLSALAPWRGVQRATAHLAATERLLRALASARRTGGLDLRALRLDGEPVLAALAEEIDETLKERHADRRSSQLMRRQMDWAIRRETDRATAQLRREARTDPLTGLSNRRRLEEILGELAASDDEGGRDAITALAIDMDHFKTANDRLGHEAGDACLVFLGELLSSGLRGDDVPFRVGGDEFIVLLIGCRWDRGVEIAERLRQLFAQMPWPHADCPRPTLSIGVAETSGARVDAEELLRRADEALYAVKRDGRDGVRCWNDLGRGARVA